MRIHFKWIWITLLLSGIATATTAYSQKILLDTDFKNVAYGDIPAGWVDLMGRKPSRNWMVDGRQFLRPVLKGQTALLACINNSDIPPKTTGDIVLSAQFKKTGDKDVFFALAGRIIDNKNFYAVQVNGDDRLSILKVENGKTNLLTEIVLLKRYSFPSIWTLSATFSGDIITGIVHDENGHEMARADFKDESIENGHFGIYATEYTGLRSLKCIIREPLKQKPVAKAGSKKSVKTVLSEKKIGLQQEPVALTSDTTLYSSYRLIQPVTVPEKLNTSFKNIGNQYDIVVAGAGTGGWAAAIQAARMGRKVLLLEETDWIGGQMANAAVTSMDESGPQVRERAIYRQFHESIILYYYTLDKDPFQAYYHDRQTQNQQQGGYEPAIARAVMYGFIQEVKKNGGKLDLALRTRVTKVSLNDKKVTGAVLTNWKENGQEERRNISCSVLIDATEYGDVIPLTGAAYRVGNTKSESLDLKGAVQDFTFTGVVREYPDGIPAHLKMMTPPPDYEKYKRTYLNKHLHGDWGLNKGGRMYRVALAWRGMADTGSPLQGRLTGLRHTLAGLNGGNDYAVTVATIENQQQRMDDERIGIYKTLSIVYYLQHELGANWSFAEDQGYNTIYNKLMMKKRGVSGEMLAYAAYLPQLPYVRESRRIIGMKTVVADDLQRGDSMRHVPTSIAVGDYFMDLHHTGEFIEFDLDRPDYTHKSGPFQLPFEAFIPATTDGFLVAEKNFSQSRIVSGATRLQPITMLTGQAVGTIAALALKESIEPRDVKPVQVQLNLLEDGATLIPRWYTDVQWNTELWRAVQLLCLYKIMDRPGNFTKESGMEFEASGSWGAQKALTRSEVTTAMQKLAATLGYRAANVAQTGSKNESITLADLKKMAKEIGLNGVIATANENKQLTQADFALFCLSCIRAVFD